MISNSGEGNIILGNINLPIQPLIDNILLFIDKYLPLFADSLSQLQIDNENEIERILNQQLVDFLNGHSTDFNQYLQYRFLFRKDDESKETLSKPDIGVTIWNKNQSISKVNSFFQIECKRLPTPDISKQRGEKEYVKGLKLNTGGMERFKNNKHGNNLSDGALIAFVQKEPLTIWYDKIKLWVQYEIDNNSSTWTPEDHLIMRYQNKFLHRYSSNCQRVKGNSIRLHHFLLDISNSVVTM